MFVVQPGFVDDYVTQGRGRAPQQVTLRPVQYACAQVYGDRADRIRSEACLRLDPGEGRLPGLLVLGSEDPQMFSPQHGTDLLGFLAGVFERALNRWLT